MRRPLRPEEQRLWAVVAATVRRAPPAALHPPADVSAPAAPAERPALRPAAAPPRRPDAEQIAALLAGGLGGRASPRTPAPAGGDPHPPAIEPNRKRRIARARDPIGGRLDLHGHDQDRARSALHAFIQRAQEDGARAVLVITGKGRLGPGVLRARVPEWLSEPPSRAIVAGVSSAEARHGGEGALYVALKRAP
ncbi:MAG: Smr/MutS family protein [Caulobacteraceae bacterium]|nr:Smr/MutS family protein [Caulobacter sp.]